MWCKLLLLHQHECLRATLLQFHTIIIADFLLRGHIYGKVCVAQIWNLNSIHILRYCPFCWIFDNLPKNCFCTSMASLWAIYGEKQILRKLLQRSSLMFLCWIVRTQCGWFSRFTVYGSAGLQYCCWIVASAYLACISAGTYLNSMHTSRNVCWNFVWS